jgi:hypothetical protein
MELLTKQIVSHLSVSIQTGFSFFRPQLFPLKKMRTYRDTWYGTEDFHIALTRQLGKPFLMYIDGRKPMQNDQVYIFNGIFSKLYNIINM